MIYREIVHTCSNSEVAAAAIASIGGDFARAFQAEAARRRLTPGALGSRLVREFASTADEVESQRVTAAARGEDLPILSGLRYILEKTVREPRREEAASDTLPAWMIAASQV